MEMIKIERFIKKYFGDVKTASPKYYEKLVKEIDNITDEVKKEMIQRIKSLFEPKTHGAGRITIGERKGLKLAIKVIKDKE